MELKYRAKANVEYGGREFKKDQVYTEKEIEGVPKEKRFKFEPLEVVQIDVMVAEAIQSSEDENVNKIVELNKNIGSLLSENERLTKEVERLKGEIEGMKSDGAADVPEKPKSKRKK